MCARSALRNTEERKAAEFAKCARKFTRGHPALKEGALAEKETAAEFAEGPR